MPDPIDLILPMETRLRNLKINGTFLSNKSWRIIAERGSLIHTISYTIRGVDTKVLLNPVSLNELSKMKRLRSLTLNVSNTLSHIELVPFLETLFQTTLQDSFWIKIQNIQIAERDAIRQTVERLIRCLHAVQRSTITLGLQFQQYEGSFDFEFSDKSKDMELERNSEDGSFTYLISSPLTMKGSSTENSRILKLAGKQDEWNFACSSGTSQRTTNNS